MRPSRASSYLSRTTRPPTEGRVCEDACTAPMAGYRSDSVLRGKRAGADHDQPHYTSQLDGEHSLLASTDGKWLPNITRLQLVCYGGSASHGAIAGFIERRH